MNKKTILEAMADVDREIQKYGAENLHYVTIPYMDGQNLERMEVLCPEGKRELERARELRLALAKFMRG